uniref:Protein kinase domain-containing protein n=1 Tax=Globisporangium ultimum (strain ATCC 200006 / CBS 805.95 / DAOM BR144) TaxID=431595 RepID=K3WDN3_GLOUD
MGSVEHVRSGCFLTDVSKWYALTDHPHALKLYGACHVGSQAFLVAEHANCWDLLIFLGAFGKFRSPASYNAKVRDLFHQASHRLASLHNQGIIHGHLRCSNLLVVDATIVKITDFGFDNIRSSIDALGHGAIRHELQ